MGEKRTRVDDAERDALTIEAKRIGVVGIHGTKTPVLHVFGIVAPVHIVIRVAGLDKCCGSRPGRHHESGNRKSYSALGSLALRGVMFVSNDVLLVCSAPFGLENSVHLSCSK